MVSSKIQSSMFLSSDDQETVAVTKLHRIQFDVFCSEVVITTRRQSTARVGSLAAITPIPIGKR